LLLENQVSTDESDKSDGAEFIETETIFIKMSSNKYDLKIEHFDDMLQDNTVQTSWAGLDSILIDEEFLLLEDEEADRIYKELK
jgi:hypothetical protein